MNVLVFFTSKGIPVEGLNPKIKLLEVSTSQVLADWDTMNEIGCGWYRYEFGYSYSVEYVATIDGGPELSDSERYMFSAKDNSILDTRQIVWDATVADFQSSGSFGELLYNSGNDLKRALGLIHENIYIDNPIYDDNNNMISARVRIYSDSSSVGTNNNIIGTYLISSSPDGRGKFTNWSQIQI